MIKRFWTKVKVGDRDECWGWLACRHPKGYGQFKLGGKRGRMHPAHRVAWALTHGPIPEGQCVCHKCDNPSCVNPAHLFLGTVADNNADRAAKGRSADTKGEAHNMVKLNEMQVRVIRRCRVPQRRLAEVFGVSQTQISDIKTRKSWAHVA